MVKRILRRRGRGGCARRPGLAYERVSSSRATAGRLTHVPFYVNPVNRDCHRRRRDRRAAGGRHDWRTQTTANINVYYAGRRREPRSSTTARTKSSSATRPTAAPRR